MAAPSTRPFCVVRTHDQWMRASHDDTYLNPLGDVVELAWEVPDAAGGTAPPPALGGGLAFDAECRLYHSVPDEGRVEKLLWAASGTPTPEDFIEGGPPPAAPAGSFAPVAPRPAALRAPRGLAVDPDDRLFVAESGARRVLVFDLWSERLLRAIPLAPATPLDLASAGRTVYAVTGQPGGLFEMTARRGPEALPLDASVEAPGRITASPAGRLVVLDAAATAMARVVPLDAVATAFAVPDATDIAFADETTLVVARAPGADLLRFRLTPPDIEQLPPLKARGYDGLGIVRVPDGRIGFWSAGGFRHAVAARLRYQPRGRVTTYRLDSGAFQMQWGRLFVDACVPPGTDLRASFITLDDMPDDEPPLARKPPAKLISEVIARPDLSPPMPPLPLVPADDVVGNPLHARESGRELPWAELPPDDPFQTYETPIAAPPGRYLWVILELTGNTRVTPRIRCLRAEHPDHDYLRRLPRIFSRDPGVADFMRRYLSMFEGFLGEIEASAAEREILLRPQATPDELEPWLASFVGLTLDERWSDAARRAFIREAVDLFRFRGTPAALTRMIEIVIGVRPLLIEHFRLRGLGGAVVGGDEPGLSSTVVGQLRVGGEIGQPGESPLSGTVTDAFQLYAHRFSVIVPAALSETQKAVLRDLLDVHRPAHTLYDLCTVDAGLRVGVGLYLEMSSVIGRTGGFATMQLGSSSLGRGNVVGRPAPGTVLGASGVGRDTRVG